MKSCALLLTLLLPGFVLSINASAQEQDNVERLQRGEIVLLHEDSSEKGGSARVQALFQTSAEAVWSIITSCESSFVFVDGLKQCEVIEVSGERTLVHQVVKKGWLIPRQDFVFESLREPFRTIRFKLVEGNLKAMEGNWLFSETPDGLLVDYSIRVRPMLPVPGFVVSWVMRKGMPDLIACIRGLAGGSGSAEQQTSDLGQCRGELNPSQ